LGLAAVSGYAVWEGAMHRSIESRQSLRNRIFVSIVSFVLACSALLSAETPPKYDLQTETKMKGTVEEVKLPAKGSEKEVVHLLMKNGDGVVDLYFCPKSFMDDMGVSFSKGDELAFTGSKVKYAGVDLILAREVLKGSDTLVLRDDKGNPVWSWKH
jgi:hypothetical protein